MKGFKIDLHVHTCLSPCAELDMTPKRIVLAAREKGLDLIAICDHNSSENAVATIRAGERYGIKVLPGVEVTTKEEVHLLGIFGEEGPLLEFQELINQALSGKNRPDIFGEQVIVNEEDEVEGFSERLLISATDLPLILVEQEIHRLGGICIAAHVDKEAFSIVSQLGFVPEGLELDAVEVWDIGRFQELKAMGLGLNDIPVIQSSDAHFLGDVGKRSSLFYLESLSFDEIKLALKTTAGRQVILN